MFSALYCEENHEYHLATGSFLFRLHRIGWRGCSTQSKHKAQGARLCAFSRFSYFTFTGTPYHQNHPQKQRLCLLHSMTLASQKHSLPLLSKKALKLLFPPHRLPNP